MTKLNQFAIQPVDETTLTQELTSIGFTADAFTTTAELWQHFLIKSLPEYQGEAAATDYLSRLLATPTLDVQAFLASGAPLSPAVFYTVALQLLYFVVGSDFQADTVLADAKKIGVTVVEGDFTDVATLKKAWYQLLNTHNKKSLTFLDDLAHRGFYLAKKVSQPFFFNGKAQAVFDMTKVVREIVYVEAPLDTDEDGKRDLLKLEILRPGETNQGLKVPSLFTASPYNQGTNPAAEKGKLHNVDVPLTRKEPNNISYEDIQYVPAEKPLPEERKVAGSTSETSETFQQEKAYSLNNYFLARGFAVVYSAGIGTKDSDGIQTCGSVEQTTATVAIIEWLAGNRRAFTNRTDNIEVKAWWCNGKVAMTGRSYLGTLATAAATTGVEGLATIVSEAAISNWYQYYRDNGLVIAPGGYPGEDADVLAEGTFSRMHQAGDYAKIKNFFDEKQAQMALDQDRLTGNYNQFWDERNYLPNVKNIKCDIMMVHGVNDWNVKPRHVYQLWQELQNVPVAKKVILHQGPHIYINNVPSIDYNDMMNLWFSHKLYGLENNVNELLPNIVFQDNVAPETWQGFDTWESLTSPQLTLNFDGDVLTTTAVEEPVRYRFSDQLPQEQFAKYQKDLQAWEQDLKADTTPMTANRFLGKTAPVEKEIILSGAPKLKLKVASSQDFGLLSFQLVDYGVTKRLKEMPTTIGVKEMSLGYNWQYDNLTEYQLAKETTPFKMITKGHVNLQNRHNPYQVDDLVPEEFVELTVELQPTLHKVLAGHQIGLVVYGTDFGMTVRGNQEIAYTLELADCQLTLPLQ